MTVLFFLATQRLDVSVKNALQSEMPNQKRLDGVEKINAQTEVFEETVQMKPSLREQPTIPPVQPTIRVRRFPNPISEDFPCLHVPIPSQPVLLAFGTTVIDNSVPLV